MVFEAVFDDLLRDRVNPGGRWQWRVFILTTIASNMAWHFFPAFTLLRGRHYCRMKSFESVGFTFEQMVRIGTPGSMETKDINTVPSSCIQINLTHYEDMLERIINTNGVQYAKMFFEYNEFFPHLKRVLTLNHTYYRNRRKLLLPAIPCKNGMMYNEKFTPTMSSATMEFDLVCHRQFWKLYVKVFDALSTMLGFVVGSVLSDRHGRKKVAMIFGSASFVFAVAVAVSISIEVFIVFRAFAGFLMAVTHVSTDVLMGEVTDRRYRNIFFILQGIYFYVIVAGCYTLGAYLCQDWRFLQLLVALPAAMSAMFGWFIEESPRWLLSKGKNCEARRIIEKAILVNSGAHRLDRVIDTEKIPSSCIDLVKYNQLQRASERHLCCPLSRCCGESKYKLHYLLCHKAFLARMAVSFVAFFCVMLCNSVSEFRIQNVLGMNRYSSYFCVNLTAVPFAAVCCLAYHYFDRRRPFIALAVFTSAMFCAQGLVGALASRSGSLSDSLYKLQVTNQFVLFGSVVLLTEMMNLRAIELFPTEVRNSAYGLAKAFGCVGTVVGLLIQDYHLVPVPYMPFCFGASALLLAVMIFLTPATEDGAVLLDTVEQFDLFWEGEGESVRARKREERRTKARKRSVQRKEGEKEDDEAEEVAPLV